MPQGASTASAMSVASSTVARTFLVDRFDLRRCNRELVAKTRDVARDGVVDSLPALDLTLGNVGLVVVLGMSLSAIRHELDQ
jgi:hypothetical protein